MNRFHTFFSRWFITLALLLPAGVGRAAEVMPPKPPRYFNDYANVVSAPVADQLNTRLEDFEKATSSQVVVAVYPRMQSPSSIEDYVHRMFQAWQIGSKTKKNGVLLAVFVQDRTARIEVGYGLEGALRDAVARRLSDSDMAAHVRAGDYAAGVTGGESW